jgi:hypothetical protein
MPLLRRIPKLEMLGQSGYRRITAQMPKCKTVKGCDRKILA